MGRRIKQGKLGEGSKYITRAKAIKKLQISLKDFRKLCILKGVYPREPPNSLQKNGKTYYHIKDINFISCDKILEKFRDIKAHLKKIQKAKTKGEKVKMKKLVANKPQYTVNHLIKERYPTFYDALRDLDDPLCLINLISIFPAHKDFGLSRKRIEMCIRLAREFNFFCIQTNALKKVFLSIKGIYYQAEIEGQAITWIQPYQIPCNLPIDVDYKVMVTFLEFYEVLMKMILFKLYKNSNIVYPPPIDNRIETNNFFSYKALIFQQIELKNTEQDEKFEIDEKFQENDLVKKIEKKSLFKGFVFYLNSEVPRYSLEFVILSEGGEVYWNGDESDVKIDSKKISHFVTDRKIEQIKFLKNREYVQPQWIYDSVNNQILLPINEYAPGKPLPPHLSPFVDPQQEDYKPERQKQISQLKGETLVENEEAEQEIESDNEMSEEEVKDDRFIVNELKKQQLTMFGDKGDSKIDKKVKKQALQKLQEETESDSEDEQEEEHEIEESMSDEVPGEVQLAQNEENQFDIENEIKKKQKSKKVSEIEQKELAKQMMTRKNQNLHKLMTKSKSKKDKQVQNLKRKAQKVKQQK